MLERHYRELLNFIARAVNSRKAAADLTQESYARVLAAQQSGRPVRNPCALLYRTARNLVVDRYRRAEVRAAAGMGASLDDRELGLEDLPGPPSRQPDAIVAERENLAAVTAVIEQLPPRCREAFILYKFDGLSYAEIAARMQISPRTVEMQLRIAMQACWQCLQEREGAEARPAPARGRKKRPAP
ncbi:RNA polymerase sigma factor [Comamonas flocculans]|uniref:Sigma-70 family RNA polymerase sigma factor n=1 Tax=Comamonas flocculans TaxID=2597701 RepID=A0A5B8RV46_9BURK|nr:sigma-70 family RNA polymerase sigma factor [Comamonas flocculans]QEA12544.1 sigma-70 family RNA polymerase sigma factor [Comamonas flocculans]